MKRAAEILRPFHGGPRNSNFHVIHFLSSAGKHFILGTPTVRKFSFSCVDAGQPSISDARFELSFFPLTSAFLAVARLSPSSSTHTEVCT